MCSVVNTHRNAHLAGSNHVDGSLIALEDFEHLAQETCSKEHARRLDLDGSNVVLSCNSLDLALQQHIVDNSAFSLRVESVLKAYWDTGKLGWLHTCWVQNLGTKVSQLGSLLKVELTYCLCIAYDTRIVVVHSVDVGPNLDFLGRKSGTNERGCEVASATQKIVHLAISVAADEALCDINLVTLILLQDGAELLLDVL